MISKARWIVAYKTKGDPAWQVLFVRDAGQTGAEIRAALTANIRDVTDIGIAKEEVSNVD